MKHGLRRRRKEWPRPPEPPPAESGILVQPLRKRRPYVSWNWLGNDQVEIGAQTWILIHPAELKHELLKSRPFTRRCPCELPCRCIAPSPRSPRTDGFYPMPAPAAGFFGVSLAQFKVQGAWKRSGWRSPVGSGSLNRIGGRGARDRGDAFGAVRFSATATAGGSRRRTTRPALTAAGSGAYDLSPDKAPRARARAGRRRSPIPSAHSRYC